MLLTFLKKILAYAYGILFARKSVLEGNGERVDIVISGTVKFDHLDMYQKSHYRRYEFAASTIIPNGVTGDFACGTGYGTVLLSGISKQTIGADINEEVIKKISHRYKNHGTIRFIHSNLLNLNYTDCFDNIVSFETIEHFEEENIPNLFRLFHGALKHGGLLIFSTPFLQKRTPEAIKMGFHLTYDIDESKIGRWLSNAGLKCEKFKYQNYQTHNIEERLEAKDFIICIARK